MAPLIENMQNYLSSRRIGFCGGEINAGPFLINDSEAEKDHSLLSLMLSLANGLTKTKQKSKVLLGRGRLASSITTLGNDTVGTWLHVL